MAPQVSAATAASLLTSVGVSAGTAAVAGALYAGAVSFAYYYATSFLINKAMQAIRKDGRRGDNDGLEVSYADPSADARVVFGEVRTGGVNMIPPVTSGDNGDELHQILAIASHEIDSFTTYYFDQDTLPTPGAISGTDNDGLISSGDYDDHAWVRGYRGTMSDNVDYKLNAAFPSQWLSTARGRGTAKVCYTYKWGKGKTYRGPPQPTVKFKGAKVYDPRLDSTNGGSGSHRYTDSTTWEWSSNPMLCWAWYRMTAYGFSDDPATEINWSVVATEADKCDSSVDDKDGGTRARYTINVLLYNSQDALQRNEQIIVDSMFGHRRFSGGKWECLVGGWTAPAWTIGKDDWLSIERIRTVVGPDDGRVNKVHCFYTDHDRNWQRVEAYPRSSATYLSDDTDVLGELVIEQPGCTNESEAQMKGEFALRQSRNGILVVGTLPPRFQKMKTFDTVAVTFSELGWTSKTFRIAAMIFNVDGSVKVSLAEEQEADWDDLATGDYGQPSTASIPATNPTTPSEPASFAVTPDLGTLIFDFEEPTVKPLGTRYQILRSPGSLAVAGSYSVLWEGDATRTILQADMRSYYWYHGRTIANSHVSPALYPNTYGIGAQPWITAETMPGNRVFPDGELFFANNSYWGGLSTPANSGTAFQDNFYLVNSGGITPQRGRLILACDSTFDSDDSLVLLKRFDVNSKTSQYGLPMAPGQGGIAVVQARRTTSVASGTSFSVGVTAEIYGIKVWTPKSETIATNSILKMGINSWSTNSGDWMTYVGTFSLPTSPQVDSFRFGINVFRIHGQDTLEIGNAQIATL